MNKQTFLDVAEVLDAFRTIPRIMLIAVFTFVLWYTYEFTAFYFDLIEQEGVTDWKLTAYSGFGALTIPALVGFAGGITKAYMDSGKKWRGE